MFGTDFTIGKKVLNGMKSKMSEREFANLMHMEGADDEKELELILTAQAYYLFPNDVKTKSGEPIVVNDSKEGFRNKMLLIGSHKGVREAFMAEDYDKCEELSNEYFATNPIEETRARIKGFVDENIDEWEKKGWVGKKSRKRGRKVRRG